MNIWYGLKLAAIEGSGAGASLRFLRLVMVNALGNPSIPGQRPSIPVSILCSFMVSAEQVVQRFGPVWFRKKVKGRAIGTWVFLFLWIVPPALLIARSCC
jgi:hypothetical protein